MKTIDLDKVTTQLETTPLVQDATNIRITVISDTHSKHEQLTNHLPGGDLIICSGDISSMGYFNELISFCKWFNKLPYDYKVFIAGNHDFCFQDSIQISSMIVEEYYNVDYLEDNLLLMYPEEYSNSIKIYGTPWQPEFMNWAFNLPRNGEELKEKWDLIPINTDILITHGPPFGILDVKGKTEHLGCELLRDRIDIIKPKIHIFGHIHTGYGYMFKNGTHFINASVLNKKYNYVNSPVSFVWNKETNKIPYFYGQD
jgi:predicted phosphodiesterase